MNLSKSVGTYVDDHNYVIFENTLTLWKSATRTMHGVNVFKEGAMFYSSSISDR